MRRIAAETGHPVSRLCCGLLRGCRRRAPLLLLLLDVLLLRVLREAGLDLKPAVDAVPDLQRHCPSHLIVIIQGR